MIFFISGAMTGYEDYNRPAFFEAQKHLEEKGQTVLNPASLPDGLDPNQYMAIDLEMLKQADAVLFLPGYEKSSGAITEMYAATKFGKKLYFYKDGRAIPGVPMPNMYADPQPNPDIDEWAKDDADEAEQDDLLEDFDDTDETFPWDDGEDFPDVIPATAEKYLAASDVLAMLSELSYIAADGDIHVNAEAFFRTVLDYFKIEGGAV